MTALIELLREREAELECQMARLCLLVDLYPGDVTALDIELQLSRVIGQWRATLVLRDQFVYRPAAKNPDRARATMAVACQQRMEALAEQVEHFARRWSSSALIATAFPSFRATALVMVAAISARFARERRLLGDGEVEPVRMVA